MPNVSSVACASGTSKVGTSEMGDETSVALADDVTRVSAASIGPVDDFSSSTVGPAFLSGVLGVF